MRLELVQTARAERIFIRVNVLINQRLPHYIQPLEPDVREVFDPAKNKAFRQGECARWILWDEQEQPVGRIAAFVNKKYRTKGDPGPVGGIGFFECTDRQEAADMLFDVAKHWLMQRGMIAMDGPINFGERDRWWGLVTEGFQEPLVWMNYNPPYYQRLFETYGFQVFFHQICFSFDPKKTLNEKVLQRHRNLAQDPNYRVVNIQKNRLEAFAQDFTTVYNEAYAGHGGLKELKVEQVRLLFRQMKPVLDPKIVWFAYYGDRPIAIFINIPDLNQWFRPLHGKFGLWQKIKFLWIKQTRPNPRFVGVVFAVVPEFQGKGVDAFIIGEARRQVLPRHYIQYEMQWIGDFNPKMINVAENLGDVSRSRRLTTYRYLFDRTAPYQRHPMIL